MTKIKKPVKSRLCGNLLWRGWPTFLEKKVEKQGKWGIMKIENAVNTVVEPYLWVIETPCGPFRRRNMWIRLNRTYEWLKHIFKYVFHINSPFVEPYLWVIETFSRRESKMRSISCWLNRTYEWLKPAFVNWCPYRRWCYTLNCTYEWYVAFAELIVLYEYYELFR